MTSVHSFGSKDLSIIPKKIINGTDKKHRHPIKGRDDIGNLIAKPGELVLVASQDEIEANFEEYKDSGHTDRAINQVIARSARGELLDQLLEDISEYDDFESNLAMGLAENTNADPEKLLEHAKRDEELSSFFTLVLVQNKSVGIDRLFDLTKENLNSPLAVEIAKSPRVNGNQMLNIAEKFPNTLFAKKIAQRDDIDTLRASRIAKQNQGTNFEEGYKIQERFNKQ